MTAFSFQTVPSIKFGEPAAEALAAMVSGFGANRLMIVSDRGVVGAPLHRQGEDGAIGAEHARRANPHVVSHDGEASCVQRHRHLDADLLEEQSAEQRRVGPACRSRGSAHQ